MAIDDDEAALEAAGRNARVNGAQVEVRQADALSDAVPDTAAVVANVSSAFVPRVAPRLRAGTLIVSGYLEPERPDAPGFRAERRIVEDGWAADLFFRDE